MGTEGERKHITDSAIEETIDFFKNRLCHVLSKCYNRECKEVKDCHFRTAIIALEKQMPKVPDYEGDGYADGKLVYDTWICPCCATHYEANIDDYDYCPNCGQRIDWK